MQGRCGYHFKSSLPEHNYCSDQNTPTHKQRLDHVRPHNEFQLVLYRRPGHRGRRLGHRGVGKSTLSKYISQLGMVEVHDIDHIIEEHTGKSCSELVSEDEENFRELERIVDLKILANVGRYIHATNSPIGLPPNAGVADNARKALPSGLDYIDGVLSTGRAFVAGDDPGIADCTLAAALQFARYAKFDVMGDFAHIRRWDADYRDRDVARSVLTL